MTVKELITHLQQFPGDTKVGIEYETHAQRCWWSVSSFKII